MSITVEETLKVPALKNAKVVAGRDSLMRKISSITVLEYTEPHDDFFSSMEFNGGELVISSFVQVKDDVEAQKRIIRRLSDVGEVGLILYYVGVYMPKVSEELIEYADSLGFIIIVMPEGRLNLRYSDVISDVMEAIFSSRNRADMYLADIIEDIACLPDSLMSFATVLRMLRDRLRCSLVLTNQNGEVEAMSSWPKGNEEALREMFERNAIPQSYWTGSVEVRRRKGSSYRLVFLAENGASISSEAINQAGDTVHLFLNLWNKGDEEAVISELVDAIISDNPIKMRRLASIFNIDVRVLDSMWILRRKDNRPYTEKELNLFKDRLPATIAKPIVDISDGKIILFLASKNRFKETEELASFMMEKSTDSHLFTFYRLRDTSHARHCVHLEEKAHESAKTIFPQKKVFSSQDLVFAYGIMSEMEKGEDHINEILTMIEPLYKQEDSIKTDLIDTLGVYLLDAGHSVQKTADIMGVHVNTIKYRIKKLEETLSVSSTECVAVNILSCAVALYRLISAFK